MISILIIIIITIHIIIVIVIVTVILVITIIYLTLRSLLELCPACAAENMAAQQMGIHLHMYIIPAQIGLICILGFFSCFLLFTSI